ncbi:MAG: hypothetical protein M0R05_03075 [Bacilli bacterium]|nr:hypothetical protein [Bacilli bacterium]MDD4077250.1 hypothetical protein [Bacilli bacterium]MDD4388049.1 hypothetical protein [Bacilli bacterium]
MDIAQEVLKCAIGIGLVFFILNSAIKTSKTKNKVWINLIVGLFLTSVFTIAFFVDYHDEPILNSLSNLLFIGFSFLYALSCSLYYFIIGYGNPFTSSRQLESKFYYQEFLYLLYRNGNDLYLKKDKNGNYSGIVVKGKKTRFLEDILNDTNKQMQLNVTSDNVTKIGKLTIKNQKEIYHCFSIEISTISDNKGLEKINAYQALNYQMTQLDKEILYRMIIKNNFDIER